MNRSLNIRNRLLNHKRSLALLLILPLAGCALWSDFTPPETTVPDKWKAGAAAGVPDKWPDEQWWKEFGSKSLDGLMEAAAQDNFDLRVAVARVREADAQASISGAPLLPAVGLTGTGGRERVQGSIPGSSLNAPYLSNNFVGTLNASYEIDFWGKNKALAESAKALADASRYDQETVALTVYSSVAVTYFDILASKERVKVAQDNLTNADHLLQLIKNRFNVGSATGLDVAQQESIVATQRAQLPPLEQHLRQEVNALALLLGKLPEGVSAPEEKIADIKFPDIVAGLPSELLQRRPDVQSAQSQLESTHADIIAAKAAFFPDISLTAAGGYGSTALSDVFRPDNLLWSFAGSFSQPLFEGGLLQGGLELVKARYEEALETYRKSAISAFSDAEDSLDAVRQTAAEEQAQQSAAETARKAYQLSEEQLKGGIVDITVVLDTQRTLFSAQDALVQAKLLHLEAIVSLYKALGGGWNSHPQAKADAVSDDAKPPGLPREGVDIIRNKN